MLNIDKDITKAETLHTDFYTKEECYQQAIEKIFACSWLYIADKIPLLKAPENVFPVQLLEKSINEPLLLVTADDKVECMTNVCTHRGFQIIHHPAKVKKIVCQYHGRRFDLEGKVEFMPEFKEVKDFPRACDHLTRLSLRCWKRFLFTSISSDLDWVAIETRLNERLGHLDIENWRYAPEFSKTYNVQSNWALYVDNYLEGFHIPFVHEGLNNIIDYGEYTTECYDNTVVQIGYGKNGEEGFELPQNHPDYGKVVVAYYYWLWPNFMLNVYTWGVQINIVKPISKDYCKVDFVYFIGDEEKWEKFGRDTMAEKVEREDEYVVESVQKGMQSRFYQTGRYSVKRENGLHYFHRLVDEHMRYNNKNE